MLPNYYSILMFLIFSAFSTFANAQIFEEKQGMVAVEAEHFVYQTLTNVRQWYITDQNSTPNIPPDPDGNHVLDNDGDASDKSYIEILPDNRVTANDPLIAGENFSNTPGGMAILNYEIYFNTPGKYYVWARIFSEGAEDNSMHVGIDGSWPSTGARIQWCKGKNKWTWESKQRTKAIHCGEPQLIYLDVPTVGIHTISFSMREDGAEFDKFVLSTTYIKPNGDGPNELPYVTASNNVVTGELKRWHPVTITFDGPSSAEGATPNPFSDFNMEVTFKHVGGKTYSVPGFYAACGDAAETSCTSGNKWRVRFSPDRPGIWTYTASFTEGSDVAINGGGTPNNLIHGATGQFTIVESDKVGVDHRSASKGRLQYLNKHYLRYSGTDPDNPNGAWFVKAGADAPENTLAYEDFDDTPNRGGRRKSWAPHVQDYDVGAASMFTWKNGKGSELMGAINYLSDKGVNAFSFLTLSLHGDDQNVFPHLLKVNINTYNGYGGNAQWNNGVYHDRFDVSKLAQWDRIFSYADKEGMYMHFKTLETENDNMMDNNSLGRERKLYLRELIARFGHHLALNWNVSEEQTLGIQLVRDIASYINSVDAYDHNIVVHTYPNSINDYGNLTGSQSVLTGASMQIDLPAVHNKVRDWVINSRNAGQPWIVANDEQGNPKIGVNNDPNDRKLVRDKVVWGTFMAGGAGVEFYYGNQTSATDMDAQDHRSRDQKYSDAAICLDFFNRYIQSFLPDVENMNSVTADINDYVLGQPNKLYVVYRPDGGNTAITLPSGAWMVQWFDPRNGGNLTLATSFNGNLVAPDNNDWVAVLSPNGIGVGTPNIGPIVTFTSPSNNQQIIQGTLFTVDVLASDQDGVVDSVTLAVDGNNVSTIVNPLYSWTSNSYPLLANLTIGLHTFTATAVDDSGAVNTANLTIELIEPGWDTIYPIHDAYIEGTNGNNTVDLRIENSNRTTILLFDVSAYTASTISEAWLELTVGADAGNGSIRTYLGSHTNWMETTVNSSTAPTALGLLDVLSGSYNVGQSYQWDVSSLLAGQQYISFVMEQDAGGNDVAFASKENTTYQIPQLMIKSTLVTSVEENEEIIIQLIPNPASSQVWFAGMPATTTWKIMGVTGQMVAKGESNSVDISKFSSGLYVVVFSSQGQIVSKKLMIR